MVRSMRPRRNCCSEHANPGVGKSLSEPCRQRFEQRPCSPAIGSPSRSNEFAHHEPLWTFWVALASQFHPRAERRQLGDAILNLTIAPLVSSFEYSSFTVLSISAQCGDEEACKRKLESCTSLLKRCVGTKMSQL